MEENKKKLEIFRGRETQRMEEGEEGVEIQDQGLAQSTTASESRDGTEKDGPGNQDSEEENHEEEEDQTGNSWGHIKLPGDVYGTSPFLKSGRNKQHVVWDDVKNLCWTSMSSMV